MVQSEREREREKNKSSLVKFTLPAERAVESRTERVVESRSLATADPTIKIGDWSSKSWPGEV